MTINDVMLRLPHPDPEPLTTAHARERLPLAVADVATAREHGRKLEIVLADFRHRRTALGERPRDPFEQRMAADLDEVPALLEAGLTKHDGLTFAELAAFVGLPGLRATRHAIARLEAEIARLRAHLARWPTPETTHRYRYVGGEWKHTHAGRTLRRGEVVELNEAQAAAFADRFEAVIEEVAATT